VSDGAPEDDAPVIEGTSEVTGFISYAGEGFAIVRRAPEQGHAPTPTPATNRRYLREALPGIYREQDLTMRFLEALEGVVDPIVAVADMLAAHFDAGLAPVDVLAVITAWLGLTRNEAQPAEELRELLRRAPELARLRGTCAGLELALRLNFPELPLRIEDGGGVRVARKGETAEIKPPAFVVYCDVAIPNDVAASVARVIEASKPAHVSYRLRIKGARKRISDRDDPGKEPAAPAGKGRGGGEGDGGSGSEPAPA
jgi:phage tail-like protein